MRNLKLITLLIVIFFTISEAFSASESEEEAIAFARFIEVLVQTTSGLRPGVICVIGNDEISESFFDKDVINIDRDTKDCRAIYIAASEQKVFRSKIAKFSADKILTIAVFSDFSEDGGMVQVQAGRRNFELIINSQALKKANIRLNSLVMNFVINSLH